MRAMRLESPGPAVTKPLRLAEVPDPQPGPGEIRVRVLACGVCRTDLHIVEGDLPPVRAAVIPGHQVVGRVDGLGPGAGRFAVGDRVGIAWLRFACGACEDCLRGSENLCIFSRYTGYHDDGGFAESAVVNERFAYALPPDLPDAAAAPLLCAGIIGYRALVRSEALPGSRLGLFGFGSSAHIALQVARSQGIQVYVATRGERHRRHAESLGAAWVGERPDDLPVKLDAAVLFAPAGELVPPILRALRPGGTLAIAGIHLSDIPAMSYADHLFHEKRLTSVEANTREDGEALLALAVTIPIHPTTRELPLAEANDALLALREDRLEGTLVLVPEAG